MFDSFLLYENSSTEGKKSYSSQGDMIKDLNLTILFKTMAKDDLYILEKVRKIIMIPLSKKEEITYRQEIIQDFMRMTKLFEDMYHCSVRQQKALQIYKSEMDKNRTRSTRKTSEILDTLTYLKQAHKEFMYLQRLLEDNEERCRCSGLKNLCRRLKEQPLREIEEKINDLDFFITNGEIGYSLQFGGGMKIKYAKINYVKNQSSEDKKEKKNGRWSELYYKITKKNVIIVREEKLKKEIGQMHEVTVQHLLKIFSPYIHQLMKFFEHFAEEMAFYAGVVHFMKRMKEFSIPLCMPEISTENKNTSYQYLYELSMALYTQKLPIGNFAEIEDNRLLLITGANQGGKSTFLRSYGIAQVLMQCGMPVPAQKFSAPLYTQIFTHFTRREDEQLNSGRLREELKRMSNMIQQTNSNSLFLLNESFASTTEKEGARIAEGILRAFYEKNITTIMVTHLYQLAKKLYDENIPGAAFLNAERKEDGTRTYRMVLGEPSHTSYGTDLFEALEKDLNKI